MPLQLDVASRPAERRRPSLPFLCSLLLLGLAGALAGCGGPALYLVSDEPTATSQGGVPLSEEAVETLARTEQAARERLAAKDFAGAVQEYKKQLTLLPGHFIVEFKISSALAEGGQVDEALEWLERSVDHGFANVQKLDSDPALDSLRSDKRTIDLYRQTRENMIALREKLQQDPWAGPAAELPAFESLEALLAHYGQERLRLDKLEGVLFQREIALRRGMADRQQADALRRFRETHAASPEAETAILELLRIYRRHVQPPAASEVAQAGLEAGCREYLETYPSGRYVADALLLQAEQRFLRGLARQEAGSREQATRLASEFHAALEEIVARHAGTAATGQALIWLAELDSSASGGARDLQRAIGRLRLLEEQYFGFEEVRRLAERRLFALRLLLEGLPSFRVLDLQAESVTPERFAGQVLVIHFWSTTSRAAQDEIASLKWLQEKFQPRGLAIFGVNLDESERMSREDLRKWLEANGVSWPQYYDGKGMDNELARLMRIGAIPFSVLVDRQGKVADVGLTGKDLERAVETLLG